MSRVYWSDEAKTHLRLIRRFIARDKPDAAERCVRTIRAATATLKAFPHAGRAGVVPGTREFAVPGLPYRLVYQFEDAAINVLAVRHGAQLHPPAFEPAAEDDL